MHTHTTHTPTHSIILSGTCFPLSRGCSSGIACTERTCRSLQRSRFKHNVLLLHVHTLAVPWIIAHGGPRQKNDKLGPRRNFELKHIIWKVYKVHMHIHVRRIRIPLEFWISLSGGVTVLRICDIINLTSQHITWHERRLTWADTNSSVNLLIKEVSFS